MESKLSHYILKVVQEFEADLVDTIVSKLLQELTSADSAETSEQLLTDEQLCSHLQISTSHFYKLKKKYCKTFPVYCLDGAKRYKQSEVENFFKSLKQ